MTTMTSECGRCEGRGAFGHEDAPGCYSHSDVCRACKGSGMVESEVEPCDECARLVDPGALTWSLDARWRCPHCQVRREIKIVAAEHPAYLGAKS